MGQAIDCYISGHSEFVSPLMVIKKKNGDNNHYNRIVDL